MDIVEMHIWLRQFIQQMGMQNVRAILPEQLDLLINTSITDTVNQIIQQNIGVTNDRVLTDNSKISQINALRSLYKVKEVNAEPSDAPTSDKPFSKGKENYIMRIWSPIEMFGGGSSPFAYLFIVDMSLNYKLNVEDDSITNYFPVRIIDDAFLSDTLNDFILAPRVRTPIAVIYNNQVDIYIDTIKNGNLPLQLTPNKLRVSYIAKPAVVKYVSDLGGTNVDCDLPEYMHIDILKHAADLYRISVSGALTASQQQEQAQDRENVRNNYRNDNNQ